MEALEKMYGSLSLFSDINWKNVGLEFEMNFKDCSFPEYLQHKALEGDCPLYLFELAFYEFAYHELQNLKTEKISEKGFHLNPTNHFLSLEFDVARMLKDSESGKIEIHQRPHVLCLYKDLDGKNQSLEVNEQELNILQLLEDGPKKQFEPEQNELVSSLVKRGLILRE